jgi:hypothetical protein
MIIGIITFFIILSAPFICVAIERKVEIEKDKKYLNSLSPETRRKVLQERIEDDLLFQADNYFYYHGYDPYPRNENNILIREALDEIEEFLEYGVDDGDCKEEEYKVISF